MARVTDEPLDVHAPPARRVGGLLRALDEFDARTRARGQQYADGGRVGALAIGTTTVSATVRGTIAYEVVWRVADDYWAPSCSCPVGVNCKHAYAVASRWPSGSRSGSRLPGSPTPHAPRSSSSSSAASCVAIPA